MDVIAEVQLGLMEIASARDNFIDYGPISGTAHLQMSDGLQRITKALEDVRARGVVLLLDIGESEGRPRVCAELESRMRSLMQLVAPNGTLDQLLNQLDDFRDVMGQRGDWIRRDACSAMLDTRVHLRQIHLNFERIVGKPLEGLPSLRP